MKSNEGKNMNELKETNRIINRHKARMLGNLEDAGCPVIFRNAVIEGLNWLRSDLNENERTGVKKHESKDNSWNK